MATDMIYNIRYIVICSEFLVPKAASSCFHSQGAVSISFWMSDRHSGAPLLLRGFLREEPAGSPSGVRVPLSLGPHSRRPIAVL